MFVVDDNDFRFFLAADFVAGIDDMSLFSELIIWICPVDVVDMLGDDGGCTICAL
jgi:hypothetical protein